MTTIQIRNDAMVELLRADFYSREDHVVLSDDMWIELDERAAPALPAADRIRVFSRDDGAGNSQLCFIDSAGVVVCSGGGVAAPHNILSATHLDAAVQAVSRGSLIYGDATPDWNELVIGPQYAHLESDGVDVAWQANLTMADDAWIGLGAAAGRLAFDSTPAPDQVEVTAADLNFVTAFHGIIHVDGVSAGPPRQLLIANGTRYLPDTLAATDLAAHNLLSAQHGDTVVQAVSRGSLIVGDVSPDWNELVHPGGAGYALTTDANDTLFDLTPQWEGLHLFNAGWRCGAVGGDLDGNILIFDGDGDTSMSAGADDILVVTIAGAADFSFTSNAFNVLSGSDIVMADGSSIGQAAGPLLTFDDTNNFLEITGCSVGIGIAAPATLLHLYNIAGAGESFRISADAVGSFGMGVFAGEIFSLGHDGAQHFNMNNAGMVGISETANTDMTIGLTINQAANDDEAFALKSSDVAHGMTAVAETDTYLTNQKNFAANGGGRITGLSASVTGLDFDSYAVTDVTSKVGSPAGHTIFTASTRSGAGPDVTAPAADSNLYVFRRSSTTVLLIDAEGTIHQFPGSDTDLDLIQVSVTGTPHIAWDESEDAFTISHDLIQDAALANKTLNLGSATIRFNTLYQGTSTAAGTSRVFESTRDCPLCSTRMVRGTGSLCILGEDRDYEVAHCPDCGVMAVEEMKHLPSARLVERRPPPKIEFLGLDVFPMSGNSRKVRIDFRYVDGDEPVTNSTYLSETELADLMAMDEATRRTFLLELGRREWEALEELRIQEEEVATLQKSLDELVEKFVGVDLLQ